MPKYRAYRVQIHLGVDHLRSAGVPQVVEMQPKFSWALVVWEFAKVVAQGMSGGGLSLARQHPHKGHGRWSDRLLPRDALAVGVKKGSAGGPQQCIPQLLLAAPRRGAISPGGRTGSVGWTPRK